jgi:FMN-dependent oxidoreductase (nitrilotriacetate monooxygenase family)
MAYNTLEYWQDLARTAERGKFDGIFLTDIVGVYDVYKGSPDPSIAHAVQVPVNDPLLVVPAMAAATPHIGFGVTSNLTYETPYLFARRVSTLDHLTRGRIGWNIVTGYLDSAARGMGLAKQAKHDDRYDTAEEYMEVVYKLWEGSWEDDAILHDRERRIYADPRKVHRVQHSGQHYRVDAIHLSEPSPQRTPVLYQAGASSRGKDFASKHAECVFLAGPTKENTRTTVADLRRRAAEQGRDPPIFWSFSAAPWSPGEPARKPRRTTRSITATPALKGHYRISPASRAWTSPAMTLTNRSAMRRTMLRTPF